MGSLAHSSVWLFPRLRFLTRLLLLFDHSSAFFPLGLHLSHVETSAHHLPACSAPFESSTRTNVVKREREKRRTDKLVLPERDLHGAIKAGLKGKKP